jgi:transposase
MAVAPWIVSDGLRERIEPLLPKRQRRFRYPGRRPLPDREALQDLVRAAHRTGIAWRHLPLELGFGSGSTCYRRMVGWQQAGCGSGCTRSCWRSCAPPVRWSGCDHSDDQDQANSQGALVDQRTLRGALSRIAFVAGSSGDEPSAGAVMFFTIAAHGRRVPPVTPASAVAGSGA